MKTPLISIIICTYNAPELVRNCILSIQNQNYKNIEIICVDGMSKDSTPKTVLELSKKDSRIKLIINKKKRPEGKGFGKWQAYKKARGEIIGFIDQDNILQRPSILDETILELENYPNSLGVLAGLTHDSRDKSVVRYVSLFGTDSFFAYRSVDFLKNFKNSIIFPMNIVPLPITGGNCFFYRKRDLDKIGGYTQDVFNVSNLFKSGKEELIILPNATKHYAEKNLLKLLTKKFMWSGSFFNEREEKFNYMPSNLKELSCFLKNIIFSFSFFPNLAIGAYLSIKYKDSVALLFPFFALANTIAYGQSYLISLIKNI